MSEQQTIKLLTEDEILVWKECKKHILSELNNLLDNHDRALVLKGARAALWDIEIQGLPGVIDGSSN